MEDREQKGLGKRQVYGALRADTKCSIFEQTLKFPELQDPLRERQQTATWTNVSAIRLQKSVLGQTSRDIVTPTTAPKEGYKKI